MTPRVLNRPHPSFNNAGGATGRNPHARLIVPHSKREYCDQSVPICQGRFPLFIFAQVLPLLSDPKKELNLTDKDNAALFLFHPQCSLFIIISGSGLLSRTSLPAWSPDSDMSSASGSSPFLPPPTPLPLCPLLFCGLSWPLARCLFTLITEVWAGEP